MKIRDIFAYPLPGTRVNTPLGPGTMRGPVTDPATDHRTATHYLVYLDVSRTVVTKIASADVTRRDS